MIGLLDEKVGLKMAKKAELISGRPLYCCSLGITRQIPNLSNNLSHNLQFSQNLLDVFLRIFDEFYSKPKVS